MAATGGPLHMLISDDPLAVEGEELPLPEKSELNVEAAVEEELPPPLPSAEAPPAELEEEPLALEEEPLAAVQPDEPPPPESAGPALEVAVEQLPEGATVSSSILSPLRAVEAEVAELLGPPSAEASPMNETPSPPPPPAVAAPPATEAPAHVAPRAVARQASSSVARLRALEAQVREQQARLAELREREAAAARETHPRERVADARRLRDARRAQVQKLQKQLKALSAERQASSKALAKEGEARKKNDDPALSHRLLVGPAPAGDAELADIIAELKRLKVENEKLEAEGREEESVRRQLDALGNERKYGNKQLSERRRTDALYKGQLAEKEKELRELQAPSPVPPTLPIGG